MLTQQLQNKRTFKEGKHSGTNYIFNNKSYMHTILKWFPIHSDLDVARIASGCVFFFFF